MPPTNYDELKQAITERFPAMSKQLQGIARFALERPNELALGTVAAIAGAAGVQPSAMVRFANALDFGGFSRDAADLSRAAGRAVGQLSRAHRADAPGQAQRRRRAAPTGVLHQSVSDAIAELGHLEESVTAAQFNAAIRLLAGAPRIHVLAQRRAFPVACYLAYALGQLELRTHLLDGVGGMLGEVVRGIAPREVLIAVSFRNYSAGVIEAAADCHRRGVPVIAITDSPLSPLKANARDLVRAGRRLEPPVPFAGGAAVPRASAGGQHRASTGRDRRESPCRIAAQGGGMSPKGRPEGSECRARSAKVVQ